MILRVVTPRGCTESEIITDNDLRDFREYLNGCPQGIEMTLEIIEKD